MLSAAIARRVDRILGHNAFYCGGYMLRADCYLCLSISKEYTTLLVITGLIVKVGLTVTSLLHGVDLVLGLN